MNQTPLASRIRDIMTRGGLTQQDLALLLEVSQPAISLYLKGRMPPAAILLKIARVGGTSIEWLLTGTSDSPPLRVREKASGYGSKQQLLEHWENLSPAVQKSILMLMKHLAGKSGT